MWHHISTWRARAKAQYGPGGEDSAPFLCASRNVRRGFSRCSSAPLFHEYRQQRSRGLMEQLSQPGTAAMPCAGALCPAAGKMPPAALHTPPCCTIHHGRYSRNWEEATYEILP